MVVTQFLKASAESAGAHSFWSGKVLALSYHGYIFTVLYWFFFIGALGAIEWYLIYRARKEDDRRASDSYVMTDKEKELEMKRTGTGEGADAARSAELPDSMWSIPLLCVIKQSKWPTGEDISMVAVAVLLLAMGGMQLTTLFLIVVTLNPDAHPITVQPSTPWNHKAWTVNCMKWIMTFFVTMFLSQDAGQFRVICREIVCIPDRLISRKRRAYAFAFAVFHYLIILSTIFVGVCAVVSFQSVPNILYSSLAITFISHVDDIGWSFMQEAFGVIVERDVKHAAGEESAVPLSVDVPLRASMSFPLMLAFYVIGFAFITNVMPTTLMPLHMV